MFSNRKYEEPNTVFRNLGNGKFQDVSAEAGPDFQKAGAASRRRVRRPRQRRPHRRGGHRAERQGEVLPQHVTRTDNHWILLKLVGTESNRMGLGAQIRITGEDGLKQYNDVTTAVGYACSSDSRVHFGLGKSKTIREIEIQWPSGIHQTLRDVATDQILTITEPARSK